MQLVANVLVGLVALIHLFVVVLEMALWTTKRGRKVFGLTPEFAKETAVLAANQGLYNAFLVAGLVYGLVAPDPVGYAFTAFFLICVIVAGAYGAATANKRILFVQAGPAAVALVVTLLAH